MNSPRRFPEIEARSLEGNPLTLPYAFTGEQNVVLVAFRRNHQQLVDSWLPFLEDQASRNPQLRFYEIPALSRIWKPARNMIDGGMAAAIKTPVVLRRTLTVYGDLTRLTTPLGITDRATISLFLVTATGDVAWTATGGFTPSCASEPEAVLHAV
jgi:hypothetical protein